MIYKIKIYCRSNFNERFTFTLNISFDGSIEQAHYFLVTNAQTHNQNEGITLVERHDGNLSHNLYLVILILIFFKQFNILTQMKINDISHGFYSIKSIFLQKFKETKKKNELKDRYCL